jgi:hypothetical protein
MVGLEKFRNFSYIPVLRHISILFFQISIPFVCINYLESSALTEVDGLIDGLLGLQRDRHCILCLYVTYAREILRAREKLTLGFTTPCPH